MKNFIRLQKHSPNFLLLRTTCSLNAQKGDEQHPVPDFKGPQFNGEDTYNYNYYFKEYEVIHTGGCGNTNKRTPAALKMLTMS